MRPHGSRWVPGLNWLSDSRGGLTFHRRIRCQGAVDGSLVAGRATAGHEGSGNGDLGCSEALRPRNLNVPYFILIE